ncbi:MAG: hypothetical protein HC896_01755, partial [Bacteroidales bacterium]|nr:hypothetical protein [Bacteroidales bacterium]
TVQALQIPLGIEQSALMQALLKLENEGFIFKGRFTPRTKQEEWCDRRLLSRIHRYTIDKLRKAIELVSPAVFMRFLLQWHGLDEENKKEGQEALGQVLEQLEGYEAQTVAWEGDILPARLNGYNHLWLDMLLFSGSFMWGRFNKGTENGKAHAPMRTTPVSIICRRNLSIFVNGNQGDRQLLSHVAKEILGIVQAQGALFFDQIVQQMPGYLFYQVEEGMTELISNGLITSDSFTGLRSLLVPDKYKNGRRPGKQTFTMQQAGRWWIINGNVGAVSDSAGTTSFLANILLKRYGVVFRRLVEKEKLLPYWRELLKHYRRLEARGEIRGGRFVEGFYGEQFCPARSTGKT